MCVCSTARDRQPRVKDLHRYVSTGPYYQSTRCTLSPKSYIETGESAFVLWRLRGNRTYIILACIERYVKRIALVQV